MMHTTKGKDDSKRLKELIGNIDAYSSKDPSKTLPSKPSKSTTSSVLSSDKPKVNPANKFTSSSKIVVSKYQKNGETINQVNKNKGIAGIQTKVPVVSAEVEVTQEDEIDEFIKRYGSEEDKRVEKASAEKKTSKEVEPEDSDSSSSSTLEKLVTPKQQLLSGLARLGDPKLKKYSLTERETFIFDLDSILKIMTFKETVLYIFPCLDVYASEQEYL